MITQEEDSNLLNLSGNITQDNPDLSKNDDGYSNNSDSVSF